MNLRLVGRSALALIALLNCKSPPTSVGASRTPSPPARPAGAPDGDGPREPIVLQAFPEYDVSVVPPGITEEELLRRADAAVGAPVEAPLQLTGWQIPPDLGFVDAQPVETLRSHFDIALGESQLLHFSGASDAHFASAPFGRWISNTEMAEHIRALPHSANSGDVYAVVA